MKTNWQTRKLENCIEKVIYTEKIQRKDFLESGDFPIVSQEQDLINGYWDKEKDLFRVSRPLIIFGDHTQILKYIDFDFVLGADGVKILQPKPFLDSKYFYYALQQINLKSLGYARHFRLLREAQISYPESLIEQKRIVKKLDEVYEKVAKAREAAEKNLQNSKELFESYLQNVFANPGKDWEEKKLNQISENLDSKRIPITKKVRSSGKYPYYGASGIVDYVSEYIFDDDLLLVSEDGANLLGRTYPIAFSINGKSWVNNHAHVLKFKKIESQRFVEYYLNSIKLDPYISGMAQPKLNQKMLNSIPIPCPSFPEQKDVIKKLDSLSEQTKKLKEVYKKKLTNLEELKKSVLNHAFTGKL